MSSRETRSLWTLLSQVLVAFTVEFDNVFELRMDQAGYTGSLLSLTIWSNLMRFVGESGITVRALATSALAPEERIKFQVGCLERWRFIELDSQSAVGKREGWGSGRGIRADWVVRLTARGRAASRIWPPLFGGIERRWEKRFGADEIDRLRASLRAVADKIEPSQDDTPLPTLLSLLLQTFQSEFDRESRAPLELCANTLRVLGEEPIREAEIPRLTGCSPETSGLGWQIKPYVIVAPDPNAKRGKVVRLSPLGTSAQREYYRLIGEIGTRWEERFGKAEIARLRKSLQELFEQHGEHGPRIAEGLIPASGTVRAGLAGPALGRRDVGAAALKRARDLVAQTREFVRDPAGSLPHYPLWDMNRGFGP